MRLARVVREGEPVLEATQAAGICIVVGDVRVIVERGFEAALLRAVIEALGAPS